MNELLEALNFDRERGGNDGIAAYLDSTPVKNVKADIEKLMLTQEDKARIEAIEKYLTTLNGCINSVCQLPYFTPTKIEEQEPNPNVVKYYEKRFPTARQEPKEGEWVWNNKSKEKLALITSPISDMGFCDVYDQDYYLGNWYSKVFVQPTPEEIQAHLTKIAEKRYPVGTKVKTVDNGVVRTISASKSVQGEEWFYSETINTFFALCPESEWELDYPNNCSNPIIWQNGKWAEIVETAEIINESKGERWRVEVMQRAEDLDDVKIVVTLNDGFISDWGGHQLADKIKELLKTL